MGIRSAIALAGVIVCASPARAQTDLAGPLADLDFLTHSMWVAPGSSFGTVLTYKWRFEGSLLEAANEVRDSTGRVLERYAGAYAWDPGRGEITFWVVAESGEVHRGRAWWRNGVLWHEAEISGGRIEAYASAVRPHDGLLQYFATYGRRRAEASLLDGEPLVYHPIWPLNQDSGDSAVDAAPYPVR